MKDHAAAIRHALSRYEEAISTRDLSILADLHWQDDRFVSTWSPGRRDVGWAVHAQHIAAEFESVKDIRFRFPEISAEVFSGRFAVVSATWQSELEWDGGRKEPRGGVATLVFALMGTSWRIVADHFSSEPQGEGQRQSGPAESADQRVLGR